MSTRTIKSNLVFWLHLVITLSAWVVPFMFPWQLGLAIFAAVMLQHAVFGKCLMNEHHGLDESDGRVFYTDLLERIGFRPEPRLLKTVVHKWLYPSLSVVAIVWQVVLGHAPWFF